MTQRLGALLAFLLALSVDVATAQEQSKLPVAKWQINLTYSADDSMQIVSAKKFADQARRITNPGMNISVETREARVTWLRGQRTLYSTTAEVPFGNRYGEPRSDGGVTVIRLEGPVSIQAGDILEVEFLGVKSRFDVPVSEVYPASSRKKLLFRLREDRNVRILAKEGPFAVDEIIKTGPNSNRLTVVVMGDGYQNSEIKSGKYEADARIAISAFERWDPWGQILQISNFHLIKVRSRQSGADDICAPDAAKPCTVTYRNTYLDSLFGSGGTDRALVLSQRGTNRAIAAADEYIGAGSWDAIIVFVNSTKYGGTGGTVATTSMNEKAPDIAVHELGHTIGKLADEYEDPYPGYPAKITEYNVDSNSTNPKWSAWLTPGVLLPTPEDDAYNDVVGAFEGARYKTSGVFRPKRDCMMRSLGKPFCPVCQEGLLTKVFSYVNLYNRYSPSGSGPFDVSSRARRFKYTRLPLTEGEFRTTWKVCGRIAGNDVDSITVTKEALQSRSSCDVSLKIVYYSPRFKSYNLTQTITWPVYK
jgi:hypothetical protein